MFSKTSNSALQLFAVNLTIVIAIKSHKHCKFKLDFSIDPPNIDSDSGEWHTAIELKLSANWISEK